MASSTSSFGWRRRVEAKVVSSQDLLRDPSATRSRGRQDRAPHVQVFSILVSFPSSWPSQFLALVSEHTSERCPVIFIKQDRSEQGHGDPRRESWIQSESRRADIEPNSEALDSSELKKTDIAGFHFVFWRDREKRQTYVVLFLVWSR